MSSTFLLIPGVCGETSVSGQRSVVTKQTLLLASSSPCPGAMKHLNLLYLLFAGLSNSTFSSMRVSFHLCRWKKHILRFPCPLSSMTTTTGSPSLITEVNTFWPFPGLLRPTWVLENYPNGVSAWRTTSWWAQPCSIISIAGESTHTCGSSIQRRSMQGGYFNKYGVKHSIIQCTGHSVWEQLEWWQTTPRAFRNFLLRKPSDLQLAFSLVIPKTWIPKSWHCSKLIGASPQKSLMLPSYMCCDFQSNVFRCHPLDVIVIL